MTGGDDLDRGAQALPPTAETEFRRTRPFPKRCANFGNERKLARILHHLVKHRCAYDASVFVQEEELHRKRREKTLRKQAALFGYELTPLQSN